MAVISIVDKDGNILVDDANAEITGGALGGLLHSVDLSADGMNPGKAQEALNSIATEIADMFNTLNKRNGAYHIDPDNTSQLSDTNKVDIFTIADGGGDTLNAGNITINSRLLEDDGCWLISAAYFRDEDNNFDLNAVGNAQNVGNSFVDANGKLIGSFLGTRTEKRYNLGGQSLEDFYSGLVGKVAAGGSNAQNLVDTQGDIVDSIYNQIKSNNSVDLNEELVDLVKYQTAFSASAQVFNIVNNCLDTLMSLGR